MADEMHQFTLFDFDDVKPSNIVQPQKSGETNFNRNDYVLPFELGDQVQIIISNNEKTDPESFYYLKEFEKNSSGVITRVVEYPKLQYEVEVGNKTAIVYHDELLSGWPGKK